MTTTIINASRRDFLKTGAGLALAVYVGPALAAEAIGGADTTFTPNAFVQIDGTGLVTVTSKHLEMGQGTFTGIATLIAEELDADWAQVRVVGAPADAKRYGNAAWGGAIQGTGGSSAMPGAWDQMRQAGATARAMLVAAASQKWQVPAGEITVDRSVVSHAASGRRAGFGELTALAASQPVPAEAPALKKPDRYTLIGKLKLPRTDSRAKTDGSAKFTQDVQLPGMQVAVVAHPPRFGAAVARFDAAKAKAIPGVTDVFVVPAERGVFAGGVTVLARDTWTAIRAREALTVEWDDTAALRASSDTLLTEYRALARQPGKTVVSRGDVDRALAGKRLIEATYEVPFLAHAAMEPLNCVVALGEGRCELWNGEQFHTVDQAAVAKRLDIAPDKVTINQLYAGGSFGRRANPKSDYILEAVALAVAARERGHRMPVKLVWTREDDTRGGYYRPLTLHAVTAALGENGRIAGWRHRIVGQSILKGSPFEAMMVKDGVDGTTVEGVDDLPYAVENLHLDLHSPDPGVPVQWWRSVGHTHSGFATEAFIDELAAAAGADPYRFRRGLLAAHPRELGVLDLAAERAGWSRPLAPAGGKRRGRGIAVHKSFDTYVAQVAEVTVEADGRFKVDRVVCAVDCGVAINPDVIRAQMEGGIGYGLSAALLGAITLKDGVVEQSNFHDYRPLRMQDMPAVEVHIAASSEKPTGVGEPGTAVVAPAVVNALFAATGQRIRRLPIDTTQLKA
ncbi:xanthine dehydrogenase family protein molybdopterin-binding subunit [Dokdonella koreensis]|uniref:Isoquinoline 1-oxidoreductase, beta subunit n=1 Tax=Dokdonella koreensis DS-123 TaxID=1300342 RepID=A0A160DSK6_9GAMM|nr:xanthine dehydrogenase family protein molybdopterin-binding subunit [Dokdonella koreensis]ANB16880.1 Putative isoquinoline 1-oxidoreductase, beta subunit [Dokdonella koreensis DS-123]